MITHRPGPVTERCVLFYNDLATGLTAGVVRTTLLCIGLHHLWLARRVAGRSKGRHE
jgi:hypothetical protein